MCGIVGYIGPKQATPFLIEGLKRLEYRGYDSAGIAVFDGEAIETRRAADAPSETDEDRLPTPHPIAALRQMAAQALGIRTADIATLNVFKRSFDARKADLRAVYIVDVTLANPAMEPALLAQHEKNPHILPTPDMRWKPPGHAPAGWPRTRRSGPTTPLTKK